MSTFFFHDIKSNDFIISIGSRERPVIFGQNYIATQYSTVDSYFNDEGIFTVSHSTFDSEDLKRIWGGMEDEDNDKEIQWYYDPSISYIDESQNVYVRQLLTKENQEKSSRITVKNEYIYISGVAISEDGKSNRLYIHKIPKSWMINEEAKAKETRMWIEEF